MIFPFESIMVSMFAQVRGMGLTDTLAGVWIPGIVGVLNVLLMRAAFLAVPNEIEDAALMDGAGEFRRFWQIFLPATRGVLTVVVITTFIGVWDDFLWPLIVLRSDENLTLMLGLSQLQGNFGLDYRVILAGAVVAFVPVAILFFIAQVLLQGHGIRRRKTLMTESTQTESIQNEATRAGTTQTDFTPDNLAAAGAIAGTPDPGYQWPVDPTTLAALEHWRSLKFGVIMHWGSMPPLTRAAAGPCAVKMPATSWTRPQTGRAAMTSTRSTTKSCV
ncbi:carbohydrate ABC transporter permease [Arthrobacter alpinus]|nr:carbohydrate ABC transporter permease [Arthrobacter alpinus]